MSNAKDQLFVASRPRFGCYSPARTGSAIQRQLKLQLGRSQLGKAASGSKVGRVLYNVLISSGR
jgi:hypothetical protein